MVNDEIQISNKSRSTAIILCFLLGGFGAHYFYVGRIGKGILYLCTAGLFGVGWIIDMIMIAAGNFYDKTGAPLQHNKMTFL